MASILVLDALTLQRARDPVIWYVIERQRQIYINVVYRAQFTDELQVKNQQSQDATDEVCADGI